MSLGFSRASLLIFAGEFEHRIDPQGRVSIPARFRSAFEDGIVLSRAYDRCVMVYTTEEWENVAADIAKQPQTRADARRLARLTFSGAYPQALDRHGRVLLPPALRQYADLGENVVIVGTGRFMEIWAQELWSEERQSLDADATDIAERAPGGNVPNDPGEVDS
ncbi:MAG: division/cell wall cluster transcriptional repressor MraZ [Dehalococcoidia bacterium]